MSEKSSVYNNIIFAGGGSRCFWQLGFWEGAKEAGHDLNSSVKMVGTTSAGCAISTSALLDKSEQTVEVFTRLTGANHANVHWRNLRPGAQAPILPHAGIYRGAMEELFDDDDLESLRHLKLRFLMATKPRWLGSKRATLVGFGVYKMEKSLLNPFHPRWPSRAGFKPVVGNAEEAADRDAYIELVLASSCVPPLLSGARHAGKPVLDGGLIDNVPVELAKNEKGETLVLLSRRYTRALPQIPGLTYVQPSKEIPITKFDYANPQGVRDAYELGREDGRDFARLR